MEKQVNFNKVLESEKSKEELLDVIYAQRLKINDLETQLQTEREQIDAIWGEIQPVVEEIKNTNKWLRFIKIIKLTFVLIEKLVKTFKKDNN